MNAFRQRVAGCLLLFLGLGAVVITAAPIAASSLVTVNGTLIPEPTWQEAFRLATARHHDRDAARAVALAAVVRNTIIQQLAREAGITHVSNEAELRTLHAKENERRRIQSAAGNVVYGPKQLSWAVFRASWVDGLRRELLRHEERTASPCEEQLVTFHARHPERFVSSDGGQLPFSEYRDFVRQQWLEARLEARIASAMAHAEVVVVETVGRSSSIDGLATSTLRPHAGD